MLKAEPVNGTGFTCVNLGYDTEQFDYCCTIDALPPGTMPTCTPANHEENNPQDADENPHGSNDVAGGGRELAPLPPQKVPVCPDSNQGCPLANIRMISSGIFKPKYCFIK